MDAQEKYKERQAAHQEQKLKAQALKLETEYDRKQRQLRSKLEADIRSAKDLLTKEREHWEGEKARMTREFQREKQLLLKQAEESGRTMGEAARRELESRLQREEDLRTR